jgi:hypothetical protein
MYFRCKDDVGRCLFVVRYHLIIRFLKLLLHAIFLCYVS